MISLEKLKILTSLQECGRFEQIVATGLEKLPGVQ